MITGIAHVCYHVVDLDAAIAYYEKLGMTVAFDFRNAERGRFGVYLHVGRRNFIELFAASGQLAAPEQGSYRHLCLEVDDIGQTVAELRGRGVETSEPKLGTDNAWQAWVTDPDGNRIELHQYLPESKQTASLS
jgi:catechol 2,3-dioxygenase-like lactoylglutathione lyase family enzyme